MRTTATSQFRANLNRLPALALLVKAFLDKGLTLEQIEQGYREAVALGPWTGTATAPTWEAVRAEWEHPRRVRWSERIPVIPPDDPFYDDCHWTVVVRPPGGQR